MPVLGELDRVAQQVQQDLLQAGAIAVQRLRCIVIQRIDELQALAFGHRRHQRGDLVQQWAQGEVCVHQFQFAGLDTGQVQRVVDKPQQVFAGAADGIDVAALARIQAGALQQFAHAEHAGHRRAHLVAEGGEEARLGLRCLLRQHPLGFGQLPCMAALEPGAIRPGRGRKQRQCRQGEQQPCPSGRPPRRRYLQPQRLLQRRIARCVARTDAQAVAARRESTEHALATGI